MFKYLALPLIFTFFIISLPVFPCAACGGYFDDGTGPAYVGTAIALSLVPLGVAFGAYLFVKRKFFDEK